MKRSTSVRAIVVGAVAVLLAAWATTASAQTGNLRGKVVDSSGKPVDQAEVIFDFVGDYNRQLKTLTDKTGEWIRAGMPTGQWKITVKKFDMVGEVTARVALNEMVRVADITIGKPGAAGAAKPTSVTPEEAEKLKKRAALLDKLSAEANASLEAGNYDDAIAKVEAIMKEIGTCAPCHAKIGDIQLKKGDLDAAEKAYLAAIAADEKLPGPYAALATLYNQQKKFAEAEKMSTKANELAGDAGDANSVFNQGIILWNQSKIPEAKIQFEKATKLDPKLAEAHYWYGMALVNEGKLPEAKAPFTEYLKLAPTGQYADTAKAILATIK
ncbi:MAG TPA: tetratricopeptide repeat protein [Vicinamibacterales bacterium]|nr:tetratricopeptide repeat protein [Vicinamibacterales bacterium]